MGLRYVASVLERGFCVFRAASVFCGPALKLLIQEDEEALKVTVSGFQVPLSPKPQERKEQRWTRCSL